ncbi:MAG: zinc-ribbon domain-containing protein [Oscillospiraceae bacterium]|jgi:uncharacterized membrane protein|nr:zinc-ribbon domain-containing protein [Oscillospiraceae bacterium]
MAFCGKCGTQVQEGVKFCPSCGAQTEEAQQTQAADAQANKTMAILAYILFFIPLITGDHKKSPFVKFHTNQGTVLFIAAVAWGIAENIVLAILRAIFWNGYTWGVYGLFSTILNILWLAPTVLCVLGIINAVNGRQKELPVIGKFKIIK